MKTKKLFQIGAITALSLVSVFTIGGVSKVHAAANDCLWNGATSASFNVATNWSNCNSVVPAAGDNLVFDNTTIPTTGSILNDDLPGVVFGNVTFQGAGNNSYFISTASNAAFALSGNIIDSTTNSGAAIDAPITLSGASVTISTNIELDLGSASSGYPLTIGSNAVTFSGNGTVELDNPIVGSGHVTVNMGSTGSVSISDIASPSFTGAVTLSGGSLDLSSTATTYPNLWSGVTGYTIASGATLYLHDSQAIAPAFAKPITLGGTGAAACTTLFNNNTVVNCGAIQGSFKSASNLTLTGAIVMTANTQFNSNDSITITGPLSGSFKATNAVGKLIVSSSNNTSLTANGSYNANGVLQTSGSTTSTTVPTPPVPSAPKTGLAAHVGQPVVVMSTAIVAAGFLLLTARRLRPAPARASARTRRR